jgi:hypothetical protein
MTAHNVATAIEEAAKRDRHRALSAIEAQPLRATSRHCHPLRRGVKLPDLIKAAQGLDMQRQRVIGLIGGMSWESSAEYYRIINREVQNRIGGVHSARILMWSAVLGEVEYLQRRGHWDQLTQQMKDAAIRLEHGGAEGPRRRRPQAWEGLQTRGAMLPQST